jgi:hypothetical protein
VQRGLNHPNEYIFLWHPLFEAAKPLTTKDGTSTSGLDRTLPAGPCKEEENQIREPGSIASVLQRPPSHASPVYTADPPNDRSITKTSRRSAEGEWPTGDIEALHGVVAAFMTQEGITLECSDAISGAILRKSAFYRLTPYQTLAILQKVHTRIARRPATWPAKRETAHRWFARVIENEIGGRVA